MNFFQRVRLIFNKRAVTRVQTVQEFGGYNATFNSSKYIHANEVVRSCVETLARYTSKANFRVIRKEDESAPVLQRMLQYTPNPYMNGQAFLQKIRTILEIDNTVFIAIKRDERGKVVSLYPMPSADIEAIDYNGRLYIKFKYYNRKDVVYAWEDLAVIRKHYYKSDIWGDTNASIMTSVDLIDTVNKGLSNAIESTANLRGIIKSTKAMLKPEDIKRTQEEFTKNYLNIQNSAGIVALDSTQEFTPIEMKPLIARANDMKELRENIYRYFGVPEDAILSKLTGDEYSAFYEAQIEPVLLALSLELTNKIFTKREREFDNRIMLEANRLQFMSTRDKLSMIQLVDRGIMTRNEHRQVLNLAPVEGGDVMVIRKEYAEVDKLNEIQGVEDDNE